MKPAFTVSLAMILIVAALLAAAADQTTDASGDTVLGAGENSDVNAVLNARVFSMRDIGPGKVDVPMPMPNPDFFRGLFDLLTWNHSFFSGTWNLLRIPLLAITFSVMISVIVSMGPVLVQVAEFFGRIAAGAVGLFGGAMRALLRLG